VKSGVINNATINECIICLDQGLGWLEMDIMNVYGVIVSIQDPNNAMLLYINMDFLVVTVVIFICLCNEFGIDPLS